MGQFLLETCLGYMRDFTVQLLPAEIARGAAVGLLQWYGGPALPSDTLVSAACEGWRTAAEGCEKRFDVAVDSGIRPGSFVLLKYAGDTTWHTRLLIREVDSETKWWFILTPDEDLYVERLEASDDGDIRAVRVCAAGGTTPIGVHLSKMCGFDPPPVEVDLEGLMSETEPLVDSERGLLGLPPLPSPPAGALVAPAGGTATPLLDLGALPGPRLSTPPGTVWVFAESAYGREKGGRAALNDTAVASGDRGALDLEPGASIASARVEIGREEEFRKEHTTNEMSMIDTETDARVMRVKYAGGSGKRHRDWKEVQDGITEVPLVDLPIDWPRTSSWCVAFLGRGAHGGTPLDHHRWCRHAAKLNAGGWGAAKHESVMKALAHAGSHDQLDLANLACIEHLCRRAQLIEYYDREKIRGADRNALGKNALPFDEQEMFMGEGELEGGAAIAKQARKAREERELARPKKQCGDHAPFFPDGTAPGGAALIASELVANRVIDMGEPPKGLSSSTAFSEVVKSADYRGERVDVAAIDVCLLSLPPEGHRPAPLAELLGNGGVLEIERFCEELVWPSEVAAEIQASLNLRRPHMDRGLAQRPRLYANLVEALFKRGLIDFGTDVSCECGVFGAWKKSGKQRTSMFARLSNAHFGHSKETPLPAGGAFSEIDLEGEAEAWFAALDLKDAFYYIELPRQLRCYFGLPKESVKKLNLPTDVLSQAVDGFFQPRFAAMPMGWARALYWAQLAHCRILTRAFPDFEAANLLVARAAGAFRAAGLQPHEEVAATQELELLGWQLRRGNQAGVQATDRRRWRLRLALEHALTRNKLSGRELRQLVGQALAPRKLDLPKIPEFPELFAENDMQGPEDQSKAPSAEHEVVPCPSSLHIRLDGGNSGFVQKAEQLARTAFLKESKVLDRKWSRIGALPGRTTAGLSRGSDQEGLRAWRPASRSTVSAPVYEDQLPRATSALKGAKRGAGRRRPIARVGHSAALRLAAHGDERGAHRTVLEMRAVAPNSRLQYSKMWKSLQDWAEHRMLPLSPPSALDATLAEYLECLYFEGHDAGMGTKVIAAVGFFVPEVSRHGPARLPRARLAAQGWLRLSPLRAGLPIPVEVVAAIAVAMCARGERRAAAGALLATTCYLRPGGPAAAQLADLLPPGAFAGEGRVHWVLQLNRFEEGEPSKTGRFDDSIVLDDPRHAALRRFLAQLRRTAHPDEPLIGIGQLHFAKLFGEVVNELRLNILGPPAPHQLRRAGASDDRASGQRMLVEIKKRGRWLSDSPVRRHEKGGRLREQLLRLPAGLQAHCRACHPMCGEVLLGRSRPLPVPQLFR
ncbi:unnamed protein product [Prorocentrum cordatum]|uniref:Uncharacterized protein n=1 Tax=Prorocentrum cordatum TaxID=2364126 RepID=A0ABN9X361_9DINO|nr:unnamed protein product [Polarella glacialis]